MEIVWNLVENSWKSNFHTNCNFHTMDIGLVVYYKYTMPMDIVWIQYGNDMDILWIQYGYSMDILRIQYGNAWYTMDIVWKCMDIVWIY